MFKALEELGYLPTMSSYLECWGCLPGWEENWGLLRPVRVREQELGGGEQRGEEGEPGGRGGEQGEVEGGGGGKVKVQEEEEGGKRGEEEEPSHVQ